MDTDATENAYMKEQWSVSIGFYWNIPNQKG